MAAAAGPAALFLSDDRIVWSSLSFSGGRTTRPACSLLIGAYRPLAIALPGARTLHTQAVLIGPNVPRTIDAIDAGFYSLTLDPAHPACRHLRDVVLGGRDCLDLAQRLDDTAIARVRETIEGETGCEHSRATADGLLERLCPGVSAAAPVEPRVSRVAAWLRAQVPSRADMQQLGELVHLSAGRLTHLFTQELGVSIRTYLRWVKMSRAIELLGRERTIAEVAATIGFADAAHFCRVLRSYYAVIPTFVSDPARVRMKVCAGAGTGADSR